MREIPSLSNIIVRKRLNSKDVDSYPGGSFHDPETGEELPDYNYAPGGIYRSEEDFHQAILSMDQDYPNNKFSSENVSDENQEQKTIGQHLIKFLSHAADLRIMRDDIEELFGEGDPFSALNIVDQLYESTEKEEAGEELISIGALVEDLENALESLNGKPLYLIAALKEFAPDVWEWVYENPWKGIALIYGATGMLRITGNLTNQALGDKVKEQLRNNFSFLPGIEPQEEDEGIGEDEDEEDDDSLNNPPQPSTPTFIQRVLQNDRARKILSELIVIAGFAIIWKMAPEISVQPPKENKNVFGLHCSEGRTSTVNTFSHSQLIYDAEYRGQGTHCMFNPDFTKLSDSLYKGPSASEIWGQPVSDNERVFRLIDSPSKEIDIEKVLQMNPGFFPVSVQHADKTRTDLPSGNYMLNVGDVVLLREVIPGVRIEAQSAQTLPVLP